MADGDPEKENAKKNEPPSRDDASNPANDAPAGETSQNANQEDVPSDGDKKPAKPSAVSRLLRNGWIIATVIVVAAVGGYFLIPWVKTMLDTVSTDDAYVNGHVTFVAPRVAGQVSKVLVDDNYRVKKGDLLVELDKEPYRAEVAVRQAAVKVTEANLTAARIQVRGQLDQTRANRYRLQHAMEDVKNQIANLKASVANLNSRKATLDLAKANLQRGEELLPTGGISKEDLDIRRQTVRVDEAAVDQALQAVYAIRVSLGLPAQPEKESDLAVVPGDLAEDFSVVRQSLGELSQSASQYGYFPFPWNSTPSQSLEIFRQQDPESDLERIYAEAPAIRQAEAKLLQARRDLEQTELNLRYCDVVSEIDGVVTRRNVNPGNNVQTGQSLMAVRSVTEIWIDANFKETQLADLRIGQRARCEVDMYGSRHEFEGRITGFTMGTGQTLALLPPQNATGNFVKIVQRLPVRIELTDYDPERFPLFAGLSVVPYVYYKERPEGPNAGNFLRPYAPLPHREPEPKIKP